MPTPRSPRASTATTTSTRCCATARWRSMRSCATPGRNASPTTRRSRCSPSAVTAAASCTRNRTSTCSCWPSPMRRPRTHDALARFFALLWDAGLPTGHAVRSHDECTQRRARRHHRADRAVRSAPAGRPTNTTCARCCDAIDTRHVWPPREYFRAKREEQRARHARFGDTADNLEPNLKEGPGGLRDIQTLRWMALRVLGARDAQGTDRARPARRRRIRHARTRTPRARAPALRPAPGRAIGAKNACASTTRRRSPRASGTSTTTATSPSSR